MLKLGWMMAPMTAPWVVLVMLGSALTMGCGPTIIKDHNYWASEGEHGRMADRQVASYVTDAPLVLDSAQGPAFKGKVVARCQSQEALIRTMAMKHRIDVGLLAGIIRVESGFRIDAKSRVGARGLMQIMPKNAKRLSCGDLFEARPNMECGIEVLSRFMKHYDDDIVYALSAYNAGYRIPNAARDSRTLPSNISYVEKVLTARASYLQHGCGGS